MPRPTPCARKTTPFSRGRKMANLDKIPPALHEVVVVRFLGFALALLTLSLGVILVESTAGAEPHARFARGSCGANAFEQSDDRSATDAPFAADDGDDDDDNDDDDQDVSAETPHRLPRRFV